MVFEGGAEEPIRPFLGQRSRFAEDDRYLREADLCLGEALGDHGWSDPVEFEDRGVPVLDDEGGSGDV